MHDEPKVLIADNDAGVTMVIRAVLARAGITAVESVEDGAAALERLEQGDIALLICDLDMPRVSGEEIVRRLGEESDPPPVLVVSAYLDDALLRDLSRSKALAGSFSKPFDLDEFADAVRACLDGESAESGAEPSAPDGMQQGGLF